MILLFFIQITSMTDFFTPVQVIDQNQRNSDHYEVQKYNNDPFMPTQARYQSIGDHRKKIILWLKNMSISARINKLTYTNKQFACLLMAMFERSEDRSRDSLRQFGILFTPDRGFKIVQQRFISKPKPQLLQAQHVDFDQSQKLIDSITIMNRYSRFDSITISSTLASDINYLFQLFDVIQNGVSHELMPHNYQNYLNDNNSQIMFYNPIDHDSCITKTLGLWFVEVVKKNLCVQYFKELRQNKIKSMDNSNLQTINHSNLQKQYQKQKLKHFKKYWNNLPIKQKQQLLHKIYVQDIRIILNQYRHTIKISNQCFPRVKYCVQQINTFMQQLKELDGECVYNELIFTKIQECLYDFAIYKYEIMLQIQAEIENKKKEDVLAMKKKINKLVLKNKKTDKNQYKQPQKLQNIKQKQFKLQLIPKQKQQQQIPTQHKKLTIVSKKKNRNKKIKKKSNSFYGTKQISQTTNDQDQDQKDIIMVDQNINIFTIQQPTPTNKNQAQEQFNKILIQFQQRRTKWGKYQQNAINRISSILQIYNLSYQLFGSVANGLAINSSDIDICVDPTIVHYFYTSFCSYREKVIMSLKFLQACFEQIDWAINFNLITTATVPVLQFQIDLSIPYGNIKDNQFNPSKLLKAPKICVDLTIESFANMQKQVIPHLGYESTLLVQEWLADNQNLGTLTCIAKHILNKYNLNKSYTGGISSYALTTIIYSFLKQNKQTKHSLFQLLLQFCKFISTYNQKHTIIKIKQQQPIQIQQLQLQRLSVQNYLTGKNLTDNCYKFQQIKKLFANVLQDLVSDQKQYVHKQYAKKLRNLLLQ